MNINELTLEILKKNKDHSLSSEIISKQIGIDQDVAQETIKNFKKDEHHLCQDSNTLSLQNMMPYLIQKSFTDKIYIYSLLESTNNTAKEMAIAGAEHGTVIIADHQTAGRGRYERKFHSPPSHGIYMSIIIHPTQFGLNTQSLATHFTAVSVCEAIEAVTDKKPKIKWVNDIFIGDKKICGILIEASIDFDSKNTKWMVIGIGINFSTPSISFPREIKEIAGAIFCTSKPYTTRNQLISEIINRIMSYENKSDKDILIEYKKRMIMLGEDIIVTGSNQSYNAIALDIDEEGRLIVQNETDEIITLSSGEIKVRRKNKGKVIPLQLL
ncbi:MAG: biotin--[acetyl-CoA-carboxylase] ligase [Defluviitaleaceae bacterium]|nr:biotin--[acetyl-CoA-carboxylase] ligase [Defluviitaleaceae bacterium]